MAIAHGDARQSRSRSLLHPRVIFELLKETVSEWSEDKAPRLGAALAYYTIFSLAPLLIIVIAVAGLAFGQEAAQGSIDEQIQGLVGREGADLVQTMIENARQPAAGALASGVGLVTLVVGALGAFGQLRDALNTIWEVAPKPGRGLKAVILGRLAPAALVLGVGFLLLVSLIVSAGLSALGNWLAGSLAGLSFLAQVINFLISFIVITLLFAMIFKFLPDAQIAWRDVWIGAALTALLFNIGKLLIGLYLGGGGVASSYGAAGSLIVVLLWVYYSAQILFFGAEFTQVYANKYGSKIRPDEGAVRVTEAARSQQGIPRQTSTPAPAPAPVALLPALPETNALSQPAQAAADARPQSDFMKALVGFVAGVGAGVLLSGQTRESANPSARRSKSRASEKGNRPA
jgi:membrane protein